MKSGIFKALLFSLMHCFLTICNAEDLELSFEVKNALLEPSWENNDLDLNQSAASWRLKAQSSILPGLLKGSGELSYAHHNQGSIANFIALDNYFMNFGFNGEQGILGYGFNYFSHGKHYNGPYKINVFEQKDRAGYESRLSLNLENLRLSGLFSQSWDNIDGNSHGTRSVDNWYKLETSYNISSKPYSGISLAYGLGNRYRDIGAAQGNAYDGALKSLQAKFQFANKFLKFSVDGKQYSSRNRLLTNEMLEEKNVYVTSSLFPQFPITILPSFRYSRNSGSNRVYKNIRESKKAALGLTYKPSLNHYRFSLITSYENLYIENANIDRDTLNFAAKIHWKPVQSFFGQTPDWSVSYQLRDTWDRFNTNAKPTDWTIKLVYRVPIG